MQVCTGCVRNVYKPTEMETKPIPTVEFHMWPFIRFIGPCDSCRLACWREVFSAGSPQCQLVMAQYFPTISKKV